MKGSYQMKKIKKACAVLLAVLSVSLLASAFAGEHNKHKVENVTPVASDRPVDLDVGDLQMVAEFEQQVVGVAVSASGRVFVSFRATASTPSRTPWRKSSKTTRSPTRTRRSIP